MAIKRVYARAVGGPIHGRWLEGERGRTWNVAPRVSLSAILSEWPDWRTEPVNGATMPESYNLWYYRGPGWRIGTPLWIHARLMFGANPNGFAAPMVPQNMLPESLRDQFHETCEINGRGKGDHVAWRLA